MADATTDPSPVENAGLDERSGRLRSMLLPKTRLEAFSDGVLAIVITLLVLELHVPTEPEGLADALVSEWRAYLAYVVSFVFIGGWWVAHSNLTRFIKAGSGTLFRLNLVALLFVSFTPYTTALLSAQSRYEGGRLAALIFGINFLIASLMLSLLGRYLAREKLLVADEVAEQDLRAFVRGRWWAVGLLVVAIVIAVFASQVAVFLYLVATVLFLVEPLIPQRRSARDGG